MLLSGANADLARAEAAAGDKEAAESARVPAWFDDLCASPRDPEFEVAAGICAARAAVTSEMKKAGYTRRADVHWK